jgi:hypothetical protein
MAPNSSWPATASFSDNFSAYPSSARKSTKGAKQKKLRAVSLTFFVAFPAGCTIGDGISFLHVRGKAIILLPAILRRHGGTHGGSLSLGLRPEEDTGVHRYGAFAPVEYHEGVYLYRRDFGEILDEGRKPEEHFPERVNVP